MATKPIFFNCLYMLFTGDLTEDLRVIVKLLDMDVSRTFVKPFETRHMQQPFRSLRELTAAFMIKREREAKPEVIAETKHILLKGL